MSITVQLEENKKSIFYTKVSMPIILK